MKRQLLQTLNGSAATSYKNLRFFAITFLCLIATAQVSAQAASATWALTSNASSATTGAVTATAMTTPQGIPTFSAVGASVDGWTTAATIDLTDYYEYKVTPTAGNMFQLNSLSFFHSINAGTSWVGAAYYSTNNFATAGTQIGSNYTVTTTSTQFNVTGLSAVVAPGTTLTIRIYGWSAQNANREYRNRAVTVNGTTCAGIAFTTQPSAQSICTGSTLTLTGAATNATSYQWRKGGVIISGATSATYTKLNATTADSGSYTLDAINGCGPVSSTAAAVTVSPLSVGGTVAGSTNVCAGTNSGSVTLSGHTGTVTRWESSLDNFATAPTTIANTTTTLSFTNIAATTYYRAVVTSGTCASANSSVATITVNAPSVGGSTAGSTTVCATSNSGSITLSGQTGSVTRWESSLNNFSTAPTTIANTTATLNYNNLTATTYFRAVVTNSGCTSANSSVSTITVNPASVGGTVSGSTSVCVTANSGSLTLSGNVGSVTGWESSLDNFATAGTPIANTTTTLNYSNITATTSYRAIVANGVCAAATSSIATVTVTPASVGGTVAGSTAVCATGNSGSLTLSGNVGSVTGWESSLDNFATGGTPIANTTATLNYTNLTVTTYFRAVVASGTCTAANSSSAVVTVDATPVGGTISGSDTVCNVSNSGTLTLTGYTGTIVRWEFSSDNFATTVTPIANTTPTQNYTNLNATRFYRAVLGSGVCAEVYSDVASITVGEMTIWDGVEWTNGVPTDASGVTFLADYTSAGNISACSVTITSNAVVTITSGDDITINGTLNIDAGSNLVLENNANLLQLSNLANAGGITVNRNSSALKRQDYTSWSSPVAGQNLFDFSPLTIVTPTSRFYTYNTSTNLYNSITSPSTTDFEIGTGYLIRMPNNHPANTPTVWNGQFNGVPTNGDVNITLADFGAGQRFNLVGNPYPSPIDLNEFVADNSTSITGTLYFWRKTNNAMSPSYCSWSTAGFVDNGEDQVVDPNDILQTGQGFFVEGSGNSTSLQFNNSQRVGDNTGQFFRSASEIERHRIWLNATNEAGAYSQMLVSYMTNATMGIDFGIDGKYNNDGPIALNSVIEGEDYTIQGRALPFEAADVVPLSFKATDSGNYTIAIDHVDGMFLASQDVFLKDNLTGTTNDLKLASYTFATEAGTFADRFEIVYQLPLAVSNPTFSENSVVVYSQNGNIVINSGTTVMDAIQVFDVRGRLIVSQTGINASETTLNAGASNQVLIVKITSDDNQTITRKVVN